MIRRDDATQRQVTAAQPDQSSWVAANAGSGKTRVLTDRVARLLLQGVPPERILCLTYTKAAASEMQNRLFKRLGNWAMRPDTELSKDLQQLGIDGHVSSDVLRQARRLFARAIEAPGGLKIQTIHSFCASLLRRFPLEAGVSPQFKEVEDRSVQLLRDEIVEEMADNPDTVHLIDGLAALYSGESFEKLLGEIAKYRSLFLAKTTTLERKQQFGLSKHETEQTLFENVFLGDEVTLIQSLVSAMKTGTASEAKTADRLAGFASYDAAGFSILRDVLLTQAGTQRKTFPNKGTQAKIQDSMEDFWALMQRVENAVENQKALAAFHKTEALYAFAQIFLPLYEARKQFRGWLDFDDLIERASRLLNDPTVAQWVLFRLDGGIDHILVDEAQDTSPSQWQVIERLAQEFTSGDGARKDVQRTIFVVGDPKQSIYSFQGADPSGFSRMRHLFQDRLAVVGLPFQSLTLEHSFRSAEPILRLVDKTFEGRDLDNDIYHRAFKSDMPGRVDLWPVIEPQKISDDPRWRDPVDRLNPEHETVILARQVATQIKMLIDTKSTLPDEIESSGRYTQRLIRPGDFLILVQRRNDLFREIIQACKAMDLPIAGADRLKIGAELAVKDIAAVLSFLALPEDDLALACALRSPLFGWSEQQLFDLAHKRTDKYLWRALQNRKDDFAETVNILEALRDGADFLRPYDLIERLLTRFEGRTKLLARLGPEAEDGIDALLDQALSYERTEIPTLTGFLAWLETDEVEIKRQIDNASDLIRVMTVHGAKGLEAPIVILPDCATRHVSFRNELLATNDLVFWTPGATEQPEIIRSQVDEWKIAQQQERLRLLYVAMTRAEKWLIIAGAGKITENVQCWHWLAQQGMEKADAAAHDFGFGQGLRLETGDWSQSQIKGIQKPGPDIPDWPDYFRQRPATIKPAPPTLSPSDLGGAKSLETIIDPDVDDAVLQYGRHVHLLLEHLPTPPQSSWNSLATDILSLDQSPASQSQAQSALIEATTVLTAQHLHHLFAPDTLAEVSITATLPELGNQRIHGTIDRLIVFDDHVLAVDFKTNRVVPTTPETIPLGLMRQMRAYQTALQQIYPDKQIKTAILWTKTAELMVLPHDIVRQTVMLDTVS
ncbi:double-strand break repair helicase AddA [Parasulfitobacter algicola]|uniref:DNA 3'-5' helicase n=1 Tax=Parasulfitobacter algicola TaxID=2614809 RepID=A0ABX2IM38_9RHOB|nr:double-strand break repair helicase AddA [Sulfitobacter algicola]NSX53595.1 double-strand break repair helicase AddA [Sulfitobacter algicola]